MRLLRPHVKSGQFDFENGTAVWQRVRANSPAMGFDDRPADRETHAHTPRLGREQRLEYPVEIRRIDAASGVFDDDKNHTGRAFRRSQAQLSLGGSLHRLDGVHQDIVYELLKLDSVSLNRRKIRFERRFGFNAILAQVNPAAGQNGHDELVDIDRLPHLFIGAELGSDFGDDIVGTMSGGGDPVERLAGLLDI
jgi:hypothetical protein